MLNCLPRLRRIHSPGISYDRAKYPRERIQAPTTWQRGSLRLAFIVALALSMLNARWLPAQVSKTSTATNHNIWFSYSGEHKLGRNIDLLLDETVRRANGLRLWQQLELSQGLDYDLSRDVRFGAGYTFVETYPYGALAIASPRPEHRLWEQVQWSPTIGRVKLAARTQSEHRWQHSSSGQSRRWQYSARARQRLEAIIPLRGDSVAVRTPYAVPTAEVFFRAAPWSDGRAIEETRFGASLGYRATRNIRVEAGYLQQLSYMRSGRERNHVLTVVLRSQAPSQ